MSGSGGVRRGVAGEVRRGQLDSGTASFSWQAGYVKVSYVSVR